MTAAMVAPVVAVMMVVTTAEADAADVAQLLHEGVAWGVGIHRGGCHGGTTGEHKNCKGNKQHFHVGGFSMEAAGGLKQCGFQ